jgi:hypothetical protein
MIDDHPDPDRPPPDLDPAPPGPTDAARPPAPAGPRPLVERVGMAAIAAVVAALFAGIAAMSFASGEPFLGVMAVIGALMTAWVGTRTLLRG